MALIKNLSFSLGKDEGSGRKSIIAPSIFDENGKTKRGSLVQETVLDQHPFTPSGGLTLSDRHASLTNDCLTQPEKRTMNPPFKLPIAVAVTLSTALLTVAEADESTINTKAYFGGKTIDANAWRAQDGHGSIGVLTDFKTGFHGLRVALDLFGSGSEDNTTSQVKGTYTAAAQLGVRKYIDLHSRFSPYVGGGINLAYAAQVNNDGTGDAEEEDMDTGLWLNAGVDYLLTDQFTAGVDLRYATAEVELYGETVELNAAAFGVSLGYRW